MFDLNNKEIKSVFGYCPEEGQVCLIMKNKLAYLVNIPSKKVYIHADPWDFFKMDPYFEIGTTIPKDLLEKAKEVLNTATLPQLSDKRIEQFKRILTMQNETNSDK